MRSGRWVILSTVAAAFLLGAPNASAATLFWEGDVNSNWSGGTVAVNTNWISVAGQVKPQEFGTDDLVFPADAMNRTNTNDIGIVNVPSLMIFGTGTDYVIGGDRIYLVGTSTLSDNSFGGANALNLPLTVLVDQTVTVLSPPTKLTIGGTVTGPSRILTKSGDGTLALNELTELGTMAVNDGTLLANARLQASVSVAAGATLGGIGEAGFGGSVNVASGATVAPGASPGILRLGTTTFAPGSNFNVELNGTTAGTGYDQAIAQSISLNDAVLNVSLGFPSRAGDSFTIMDSELGISGTFAGLPDLSTLPVGGRTFQIDYTANQVVLTDVTPPDADGDGVPDTSDGCPLVAGPPANSGCPEGTDPPGSDTNAPQITLVGKKKQPADRAIEVRVSCDEACTAIGSGTIIVATPRAGKLIAKRVRFELRSDTESLAAGEKRTLELKVPRKPRRKTLAALKNGGRASTKLTVTAADAAGNSSSAERAVRLKTKRR